MFYFFSSQYCLSKKLTYLHYLVIFDTKMTNKWKTRFDKHQTVDGNLDVPKRYLYINLKFGLQFYPNKPTFPLELPAEALGKLYFKYFLKHIKRRNAFFAFYRKIRLCACTEHCLAVEGDEQIGNLGGFYFPDI